MIENLIFTAIITFSLDFMASKMLKSRHNHKIIGLAIVALTFLFFYTNYGNNSIIIAFISITLFILYLKIFYYISLLEVFLITVPLLFILMFSQTLISEGLSLLSGTNINRNPDLFRMANIAIYLLDLFLINLYTNYCVKYVKSLIPNFSILLFLMPISSILLIDNFDYLHKVSGNKEQLIVITLFQVLASFIVTYVFFKVISSAQIKKDIENTRHAQVLSKTKYDLLEDQYNANFNFVHTILHKCNRLTALMKSKEYNDLELEIADISDVVFNEFNSIYSNSLLINKLVSNRLGELTNNDISIKSTIEHNDFSFLSDHCQNELFEAILTLAINSCKKIKNEPRSILIKTTKKSNQVILQYLFNGKQNFMNKNKEYEDIVNLVNEYSGIISTRFNEANKVHSVIVLFNLNK